MNNFFDKVVDFLYHILDYIIVAGIIIIVALVVGWKLDLIFNDKTDIYSANNEKIYQNESVHTNKTPDELPKTDTAQNPSTPPEQPGPTTEQPTTTSDQQTEQQTEPQTEQKPVENTPTEPEKKPEETSPPEKKPEETQPSGEIITITIKEGTTAVRIGQILADAGLILNAADFDRRSVEMKLDTVLKSGTFQIPKGTSLDDIIRIIAKVR